MTETETILQEFKIASANFKNARRKAREDFDNIVRGLNQRLGLKGQIINLPNHKGSQKMMIDEGNLNVLWNGRIVVHTKGRIMQNYKDPSKQTETATLDLGSLCHAR